ncbi:MAG TPA: ABC transporter permease, partial [Acidimicrobiales bacterium]|nr:ABC transporter permease [Acidimicrobiales bacterium]
MDGRVAATPDGQLTSVPVLEITSRPDSLRSWWLEVYRHLDVLIVLARKDFHTRYKRASLGLTWAVAVPVLQASIMAVVFSRVVRTGGGRGFGIYVMSGIIAYSYFSTVLNSGVTSLVDGSSLTEKVWFPRILLAVVPVLSNVVGLVVTSAVLLVVMPVLGVGYKPQLVLLLPGILLLAAFVTGLSLCVSALNVYFRDVKFLVLAALLVWMYVTPIVYPMSVLGGLKFIAEANPLTGVVSLFHMATVGSRGPWVVPLIVSLCTTFFLLVVGTEAHRRHDRLFVDL